jgi:hypothetical protein
MTGKTLEQLVDTNAGKAILTGQILGLLMKAQAEDRLLGVLDVRPVIDDNGDYLPQIDVTMRSGTYRIGVIDEHTIEEEP